MIPFPIHARHPSRANLLPTLLLGVCLVFLLPAAPTHADVGPKPQMQFVFQFEGDPIPIVSGQLYECEDETCAAGAPLEEMGPQGFDCTESECSSIAYGYADYHKLVIEFEDGTRESQVFTKRAFSAKYEVSVVGDELRVEEKRRLLAGSMCCSSFGLTLVLETLVALGYIQFFSLPRASLPWVPLASVLTLPVVWLVVPALGLAEGWVVGLGEGFALVAETALIYAATWRTMPFKHVAALTALMNGASFAVGLLL